MRRVAALDVAVEQHVLPRHVHVVEHDDGVHFLPKPFTLEELSHAVARAMNDETPIAA